MLAEKDLNVLPAATVGGVDLQVSLQQAAHPQMAHPRVAHPQAAHPLAVHPQVEDQEEFDRLKEVIPTLADTNTSQVKIVQEATHYIQYLRQEVAQKLSILGIQGDGTTDLTSPCWLAQFLANQGLEIPEITSTTELLDDVTTDLPEPTDDSTCFNHLHHNLAEENDSCRETTDINNHSSSDASFEENSNVETDFSENLQSSGVSLACQEKLS